MWKEIARKKNSVWCFWCFISDFMATFKYDKFLLLTIIMYIMMFMDVCKVFCLFKWNHSHSYRFRHTVKYSFSPPPINLLTTSIFPVLVIQYAFKAQKYVQTESISCQYNWQQYLSINVWTDFFFFRFLMEGKYWGWILKKWDFFPRSTDSVPLKLLLLLRICWDDR